MLDEIAKHIEDNVTSLVLGENLFKNYYPDSPDTIVSVIANGGYPPPRYSPTKELIFDIKIRSIDYNDGVDLGNKIMNLFDKENYHLGSFFVLGSYAMSELSYLYSDSKNRDEFSLGLAFFILK